MGQNQSSDSSIPGLFSELLNEEPVNTLISEELHALRYDQFIGLVNELNAISRKCIDPNGKQLIFAVKKGSDSTVFWKATIQIAAVKLDSTSQKVETYRLLSLAQFLKVFKSLKLQISAAEQSKLNNITVSSFFTDLSPSDCEFCCICYERKNETTLSCAHSYCTKCIEEWSETHDTCPICRAKMEDIDESWVLSEVPKPEDISKEIRDSLLELAEEKRDDCITS